MNKWVLRALLILLLTVLVLPLGVVFGHAAVYRNKIYPGIKIAKIDVGGLTSQQAEERLRRRIIPPDTFSLSYEDDKWDLDFDTLGAELQAEKSVEKAFAFGREKGFLSNVVNRYAARGATISLPISWDVEDDKIAPALAEATRTVALPAVDAQLLLDREIVKIQPHQNGRELQVEKTVKRIKTALLNNRYRAKAAVKVWEPKTTTAGLKKLRIEAQVAEFSTSLSPARDNRRHNIELAVGKINGTYIAPGEVFSYNKIVGTRTKENGFRMASVILDGNLVPGIGGGICQVSTTLYNVAMIAGLPTVERSVHSNYISNYPAGRDSTVVDGVLDLKFRNDTEGTLLIKGEVTTNAVIFRAYGPKTGRVTVFGDPVVTNIAGFESKVETDTALPPGAVVRDQVGVAGRTVQVARKVTQGAKVLIDEVTTSRYLPRRELLRVGPAPEPPKPATDSAETTPSASQ